MTAVSPARIRDRASCWLRKRVCNAVIWAATSSGVPGGTGPVSGGTTPSRVSSSAVPWVAAWTATPPWRSAT